MFELLGVLAFEALEAVTEERDLVGYQPAPEIRSAAVGQAEDEVGGLLWEPSER